MTERERKTAYAWSHIKQAGSALAKRGDVLLPGYRELKKMGVVSIDGAHVQLAGDHRRAFLAGEDMPSWADLSSGTKAPTKEAHSKKKSPAQLQREIDEVLAKGPSKSKSATVLVYSRPSGYWYAQAHDASTGAQIAEASGYSREDVLRELRGKFAMLGTTIKTITDEDPYAVARHAMSKSRAALKDIEPGLRGVAHRMIEAENRFLDYAMEHGRLSRDQARTALEAFSKARVLKFDAVNGTFHVKHGQFLEPEVLRRAAGIEE